MKKLQFLIDVQPKMHLNANSAERTSDHEALFPQLHFFSTNFLDGGLIQASFLEISKCFTPSPTSPIGPPNWCIIYEYASLLLVRLQEVLATDKDKNQRGRTNK